MGAGKSKLGQLLAGMLSMRFEDLDAEIVKYEDCSIPELFALKGEAYFREAESHHLSRKIADKNRILSLGGGAMQTQNVVDEIKRHNLLVYLEPPFDEIINRLKGNSKRPLLLLPDGTFKPEKQLRVELAKMLDVRLPFYQQAHLTFNPNPEWSPHRSATTLKQHILSYESTH